MASCSAYVWKGLSILDDATELNEGYTFLGKENDLRLFALHQCDFHCSFELSNYPFDTQKCSIDIEVPREIRQYVKLQPKLLNYSGNNKRLKDTVEGARSKGSTKKCIKI